MTCSLHPRLSIVRSVTLTLLALCALAPAARADNQEPDSALRKQTQLDKIAPYRRIIWVTRWDYATRADVERICYNAASARFTDVLFQVRGEGTTFFKSPVEPWAGELNEAGPEKGIGIDPGWDPLQVAIREGHRYGLRVHAWVNTMPAWNHRDTCGAPRHLCNAHRDWLMKTPQGTPMQSKGFYACLDPGVPDVKNYLANLFGTLARDYAIDGIHLDYIRYPQPEETGWEYVFHPLAAAAFKKQYGKTPQELPEKCAEFRRAQVTGIVEAIRKSTRAARPGIELTAAVLADPVNGHDLAMQDPHLWLQRGLVDAIAPMNYVRNDLMKFAANNAPYLSSGEKDRLWVGVWPRKENPGYLDQVRDAINRDAGGVAIFSYETLFHSHQNTRVAVEMYKTFTGEPLTSSKANREVASASSKPGVGNKVRLSGKTASGATTTKNSTPSRKSTAPAKSKTSASAKPANLKTGNIKKSATSAKTRAKK